MSRFIDPTTDFGFKKIFGDEANKDSIMGFIAGVLENYLPKLREGITLDMNPLAKNAILYS